MLERHHFWSFKNKEERRSENEQEKQKQEHFKKERADDVAAHTHLDHIGRKGFLGLEHSIPSFVRHTRNLIYATWVRGRAKQTPELSGSGRDHSGAPDRPRKL